MGYEPKVSYFFGFPKAIQQGGVAFDIPLLNVTGMDDGDKAKQKQFVLQTGLLSSSLEHAVPEQMFNTDLKNQPDAVSAVKAIQKAISAGQRIYRISQSNQSAILRNIHHDSKTMTEITYALSMGKEVITHTDAISIPGWNGAGYIITDPDTGSGAYKIAGGGNGSYYDFCKSEGNDHFFCNIYIYVYECSNDNDPTCGFFYGLGGALVGAIGAALGPWFGAVL